MNRRSCWHASSHWSQSFGTCYPYRRLGDGHGTRKSERIRGIKSGLYIRLMSFSVYTKHTGDSLNTDKASNIEAQAHLKTREDDRQFSHPRSFLSLSFSSPSCLQFGLATISSPLCTRFFVRQILSLRVRPFTTNTFPCPPSSFDTSLMAVRTSTEIIP
ncbi:hypothetical protein ARMSODRAFT_717490 [Armillaria solidipes]|uniref:Uncharacterized protein n=1 Tax=Armillaria solidipes TaxID=1076256 RepID=A0A2H3C495_9AGAR|nr:hypothetical protein ARMSODRAFT_717490 [Armillaria solidipes]